jgi:hypothetical protein
MKDSRFHLSESQMSRFPKNSSEPRFMKPRDMPSGFPLLYSIGFSNSKTEVARCIHPIPKLRRLTMIRNPWGWFYHVGSTARRESTSR